MSVEGPLKKIKNYDVVKCSAPECTAKRKNVYDTAADDQFFRAYLGKDFHRSYTVSFDDSTNALFYVCRQEFRDYNCNKRFEEARAWIECYVKMKYKGFNHIGRMIALYLILPPMIKIKKIKVK
jgi:hypothetical protein